MSPPTLARYTRYFAVGSFWKYVSNEAVLAFAWGAKNQPPVGWNGRYNSLEIPFVLPTLTSVRHSERNPATSMNVSRAPVVIFVPPLWDPFASRLGCRVGGAWVFSRTTTNNPVTPSRSV